MKLKYFFAAALALITNTSFAALSPQFIGAPASYICGLPTTASAHSPTGWCDCFHDYLVNKCKAIGGTQEICTDANMRNVINEYGGPSVLCASYHGSDMDVKTCVTTLSYYVTQCPLMPE